jgi:hypothetical protein
VDVAARQLHAFSVALHCKQPSTQFHASSRRYEQKRSAVIAAAALEKSDRQWLRRAMSEAKCPLPESKFQLNGISAGTRKPTRRSMSAAHANRNIDGYSGHFRLFRSSDSEKRCDCELMCE